MKNFFRVIVLLALFLQAPPVHAQNGRSGEGAGYSTRNATVLSMMGWGVGLAVGIALLCGYLEQETGHAH